MSKQQYKMGKEEYSNSLLQAMSIIAKKTVAKAGFNKTIQAVIVECKDPTIEKYRVRYQDGFWEAYGNGSGTKYLPGTSVYVLVPNGDMTKSKTIIGTVQKLGINYINTVPEENLYSQNGNNLLVNKNNNQFALSSYQTKKTIIYDKSYSADKNLININVGGIATYLRRSSHLKCSFNIRTSLDPSQRYNGNYGIKFYLNFSDRTTKKEKVTREYVFDTYLMSGNPYLYTNKVSQTAIFEIDGTNFRDIERIELFTEGFPTQRSNNIINDIFISNLSFIGANQLSSQEMSGVSLSFVAKQGYVFNSNSAANEKRKIQAIVRVSGKTVNDTVSQKLSFYWFVQNISITKSSPFYNKYGGYGWKCLNTYKVLKKDSKGNPTLIDFNPAGSSYMIPKTSVQIKQQKYKCVVLYGNEVFSKDFSIFNYDANYEIQIESDKGTQFILDSGYPTLKCVLKENGKEVNYKNYKFHWGVTDNKGTFNSLLQETSNYNTWNNAIKKMTEIENGFKNNTLLKNEDSKEPGFTNKTNIEVYNQYKNINNSYKKIQIVYENYIYHVNIKKIINFNTFVCTVLDKNNNVIGSKEITLINKTNSNGGYSLVINNGKQSFNYDEEGLSPCKNKKVNFVIPELTFSLFNEKGEQIDQDEINPNNIQWIFPNKNNTLLTNSYSSQIPLADGRIAYSQRRTFIYKILDRYISNKNDNDIELQVKYNGYTLIAKTNFFFTKEGFLGTNGTGISLRIVAKNEQNNIIDEIPSLKKIENEAGGPFNFSYLEAQLYENGQKITNSSGIIYQWSILKSKNDSTNLKLIDKNYPYRKGISYISASNSSISNIVKVSVVYNQRTVYATLPIIVYTVKENYKAYNLKLADNTGFQYVFYAQDGTRPQYDNKYPFTFILTKKLGNDKEEDITENQTSNYVHSFRYTVKGNLIQQNAGNSNVCILTPKPTYDGSILNNSLLCEVIMKGSVRISAYVPIHMMLNRYGHAALNDWDGNSIQIEEGGDIILSPQVGAGQKNKKTNTFTGILMGTVKSGNEKENGLFGYSNGARTIFLNAKTGNAEFGLAGKGQIKIDANKSQITGGNYLTNGKEGLLIDLQQPMIKFGSGKFQVNSKGEMTAVGGGNIAGWNIKQNSLNKGTVGMSSDNSSKSNIAFWAGNADSSKAPFSVNFNGDLKSTSMDIGNKVYINNGKIYSEGHTSLKSSKEGFYLSKDGLSIGASFTVSSKGSLIAREGYIGNGTNGFKINPNYISNGKVHIGTDKISLGSTFSVNNTGFLTASKGKLAGWNFNENALYNDDVRDVRYGDKNGVFSKGIYFGPDGFRMGANFHVNKNGYLYAVNGEFAGKITSSEGEIGGWKIRKTSLEGGKMSINSNGSMSGNGWSIGADGKASFKNMNMSGGTIGGSSRMNGGTIGGSTNMVGGTIGGNTSMIGGEISTSQVRTTSGQTLDKWCENIVAKTVTADEIKSKIAKISTVEMNYVYIKRGGDIKDGYGKSEIASRKYVDKKIGDATSSIWEAIGDIRGKLPK